MKRGYVRFWRMFRDDPEWPANKKREFTHFEARWDLYCDVRGTDGVQEFKGFLIPLKRGQVAISTRDRAKMWRWGKSTVDRFLKRLENRGSVKLELRKLGHLKNPKTGHHTSKKTGHHFTIVTFLEYDTLNPLTKQEWDTKKFEKRDTTKKQKRDTFKKNGTPKWDTKRDTKPTEEKRPFLKQKRDIKRDTKMGHLNINVKKDNIKEGLIKNHPKFHIHQKTKTKNQKSTAMAEKLLAEFDQTTNAGEKAFQNLIGELKAKDKVKPS